MSQDRQFGLFFRKHRVAVGILTAILVLILVFDWNWLRGPLERYVSNKTQRDFEIADLDVDLGMTPTIKLQDIKFGNANWASKEPMASVRKLEFSISLRDLFDGKLLVPRVALSDADLLLEKSKDGRKNWILAESTETTQESVLRISTLSVTNGRLRFLDRGIPFELNVQGSTFEPDKKTVAADADAKPSNAHYSTQYTFNGKYKDASFSGHALTGEVLSFQESGIPFPIRGQLVAGTTRLELEGTVADAAKISGIDVVLHMSGQTLANLYPFLLLPLPASPPYDLRGNLKLVGNQYSLDNITGKIGSTDIQGDAAYVERDTRPLLTAKLHSKLLNMSDLGPMVGIRTKQSPAKPVLTQAETQTSAQAASAEQRRSPTRVLPAGTFEGSRLQKIDADVTLTANRLKAPTALPFESLQASFRLQDAILKLDPVAFGFAGGAIVIQGTMDARQPVLRSNAHVALRSVHLDRLFPDKPPLAKSSGLVGASLDIRGTGNSIAAMAAKADGTMSAVINGGRISNLLDALSGLNGGKALHLLAAGDKDIAVNCGAVAFEIKSGQGASNLFVIDTEQTQILGVGAFNLDQEVFDITIEPKPKKLGILSFRTPLKVSGTFRDPEVTLEKPPLAARALAVVVLGSIVPIAALLPLIEPGSGDDTDCHRVVSASTKAQKQVAGK